jgi:hypothetical protein
MSTENNINKNNNNNNTKKQKILIQIDEMQHCSRGTDEPSTGTTILQHKDRYNLKNLKNFGYKIGELDPSGQQAPVDKYFLC